MNTISVIVGMIASVVAIITGIVITARWLANRFDKWAQNVVENTGAVRDLSSRVTKLETTLATGGSNVS